MIQSILQTAVRRGKLRELDLHIGLLMEKMTDKYHAEVRLAATLASASIGEGNVCLPLNHIPEYWLDLDDSLVPDAKTWRASLLKTRVVGRPGEIAPLILDEKNRLYLFRYFTYEQQIAEALLQRADELVETDINSANALLTRLFPNRDDKEQKRVAAHAILKRLLIISGGAGTGKTYTVTRILALLQSLAPHPLSIELAAPTGKAAARLKETIQKAKQGIPSDLARKIPDQAKTLHRLLGFKPNANDFIYNEENRLNIDLLVVDEASMIDVAMMSSLLKALPASARLILLGDHNQLTSVEAGNLFADLCGTAKEQWSGELCAQMEKLADHLDPPPRTDCSTLSDCFSLLEYNYRQDEKSGIYTLSQAVIGGSMLKVNEILRKPPDDLSIDYQNSRLWSDLLFEQILKGYGNMTSASTVEKAFQSMEQFRVLCALNDGPYGVSGVNSITENLLRDKALIPREKTKYYRGKPVIILENHYPLRLFNGDTGILWDDPDDNNKLKAWFRHPESNALYGISPGRLPAHDCAFAITIHKSQGSEYEHVLLLLPDDKDNQVLNRELLYTGITRAGKSLSVYCKQEVLAAMVNKKTRRHSGLYDSLWSR